MRVSAVLWLDRWEDACAAFEDMRRREPPQEDSLAAQRQIRGLEERLEESQAMIRRLEAELQETHSSSHADVESESSTATGPRPASAAKGRRRVMWLTPGGPLKPSTGKFELHPADCDHPRASMTPRGNQVADWLTCQKCGSRWTRVRGVGQQMQPAPEVGWQADVNIAPQQQPETPRCPAGHPWTLREESETEYFWGCPQFPRCRHALAAWPQSRATSSATTAGTRRPTQVVRIDSETDDELQIAPDTVQQIAETMVRDMTSTEEATTALAQALTGRLANLA